jgi:hypothetical protein
MTNTTEDSMSLIDQYMQRSQDTIGEIEAHYGYLMKHMEIVEK